MEVKMAMPESKSDTVRRLVASHRWKEALKIAATFRLGLTQDQRRTIGRAYESYHYGYMQAQMKRDPEECRKAGIELLKELYGSPDEAPVKPKIVKEPTKGHGYPFMW
jgi:hypothetical protein